MVDRESERRRINDLPDEELQRRYIADEDDGGDVLLAIYTRYRDEVRTRMEEAGLEPASAERRVGSVFIRGLDRMGEMGTAVSLRECLLREAEAAALDPSWTEV